jgi:hypothetical protein
MNDRPGTTNDRRLVLVLGVGRSGTSLVTGILGQVGFHIPQPEITADETNPRGFGEPKWVVQFHERLMRRVRVTVFDSRPKAWAITGEVANEPAVKEELRTWLGAELSEADAVVVKDPRIGWFLPLWMSCSDELGVPPSYLFTLRHPAEILASARAWYGTWQADASRAAAWLNVMLETERATRGKPRVYVRYEDLVADWLNQIKRIGEVLDLSLLRRLDQGRLAQVGEFVDPTLHRSRVGWDDLEVPASVRQMAEEVWGRLQQLPEQGGDNPAAHAALDTARHDFAALYSEAESIAQSSAHALRPRRRKSPPPTLRARIARRLPQRSRKLLRRAGVLSRPCAKKHRGSLRPWQARLSRPETGIVYKMGH